MRRSARRCSSLKCRLFDPVTAGQGAEPQHFHAGRVERCKAMYSGRRAASLSSITSRYGSRRRLRRKPMRRPEQNPKTTTKTRAVRFAPASGSTIHIQTDREKGRGEKNPTYAQTGFKSRALCSHISKILFKNEAVCSHSHLFPYF